MEIVYNGYDNKITLQISQVVNNVSEHLDFSGVDSMELLLPDSDQTITTGIDWSAGNGVVRFNLGDAGLTKGHHPARLIAFDPLHPDGQVILHETVHNFVLWVLEGPSGS